MAEYFDYGQVVPVDPDRFITLPDILGGIGSLLGNQSYQTRLREAGYASSGSRSRSSGRPSRQRQLSARAKKLASRTSGTGVATADLSPEEEAIIRALQLGDQPAQTEAETRSYSVAPDVMRTPPDTLNIRTQEGVPHGSGIVPVNRGQYPGDLLLRDYNPFTQSGSNDTLLEERARAEKAMRQGQFGPQAGLAFTPPASLSLPEQLDARALDLGDNPVVPLTNVRPDNVGAGPAGEPQGALGTPIQVMRPQVSPETDSLVRVGADLPTETPTVYDLLNAGADMAGDVADKVADKRAEVGDTFKQRKDALIKAGVELAAPVVEKYVAPVLEKYVPRSTGVVTNGPGSYYERGIVKQGSKYVPTWMDIARSGSSLLDTLTGTSGKDINDIIKDSGAPALLDWLKTTKFGEDGKVTKDGKKTDVTAALALVPGIGDAASPAGTVVEKKAPDAAAEDDLSKLYQPASIDDYRKMIDATFGEMDFTKNPAEERALAYAAQSGDRDAALAQLALAGGLLKSAGKSWEGAGEGFIGAAGVYDKGFTRYENALAHASDTYSNQMRDQRAFELAKRGAVLDMWTSGEADKRAALKEYYAERRQDIKDAALSAREEKKMTNDNINKYYADWAAMAKGDMGADAETIALINRLHQLALTKGEIIPPDDYVTSAADK